MSDVFRHGVASGEPSLTSLGLWTRVTTSEPALPLRWVIEVDDPDDPDGIGGSHRSGTVVARHQGDHTVFAVVEGLRPGVRYRYRFEAPGGQVSPTGRARTIPTDAGSWRIGFACCARYGLGHFTAYRLLAEEACDLIVHLGDYVYEDAEVWVDGRVPDPAYEARTLGDYRRRHATHRRDPDLQALHHAAPMLAIWDDHDVANSAPEDNDLAARQRRHDGQQAWREWLPTSARGAADPIDRLVTVPGVLDLAVVDARFTGRAPHRRTGPRLEPRRQRRILSPEQWVTLETTWRASTAPWRIFANQVQVGPMRLGAVPSIVRRGMRPIVNPDQWDGFRDERRRLLSLLDDAGPTLIVSGDLHSTWFRTLAADDGTDDRRAIAHELTVTSVAGESYAEAFRLRTKLPPEVLRRVIVALNEGIEHLDLEHHGYAVVDVLPDRIDVTAVLLDTTRGPVSYPLRVRLGTLRR